MRPLLIMGQVMGGMRLRGLRGHRGRGLIEGLERFAWDFKMGLGG